MLQRPFVRSGTTTNFGDWLRPFVLSDERSLARDRALYRSIDIPALVLWGTADSITPVQQGREIAGLIPGASFKTLPGVGHIPAIEATGQFNAALVGWLASSGSVVSK